MPFTVSHIAATLPFAKHNNRFHLPAMMLGCMAPDFEYFLRGRPLGLYGHTLPGIILLDLPLVVLLYLLGRYLAPPLIPYLPTYLQVNGAKPRSSPVRFWIRFLYSAFIGVLTHIIWDSFTHANGSMVTRFSVFQQGIPIARHTVPLYKLLQHGSTLAGFLIIACYLLHRRNHPSGNPIKQLPVQTKYRFWGAFTGLALLVFALWSLLLPIPFTQYGVVVVRLIDAAAISLVILCLFLKFLLPHPRNK